MDNLETLFDKQQYDLIIKLTEDSFDYKECFLHLLSLVMLKRYDDALVDIANHQTILEKGNLYKLIKLHFELLFSLALFDEAKKALKHYQDLPYDSQKVEELLIDLPKQIEEEEHPNSKVLTLDEANEILLKESDNALLAEALFSLKELNFKGYVDALKTVIVNEKIHPNLRTFGLIVLKENEYDKEVEFLTPTKELIKVNPHKLEAPFCSKAYFEVRKGIDELAKKDVSMHQTAFQLLNCLVMDLYPSDINLAEPLKVARAIILLAKESMQQKNINEDDDIILLKNKISDIAKEIPDLVL